MAAVISIKNFKMRFGRTTIIEDLSFEVKKGEVFGFLGANGSGKTTTIRALLGIYRPSGGELTINGEVFTTKQASFLGYLPEERGLYKKEKVIDVMTYFGQLKGLTSQEAREWSLAYLRRVNLEDKAFQFIDKLSGGQQQKVQLGVTIINAPKLLILDEPTKGFDPVNRRLMMDIIEELRAAGSTIVLVTHHMEEVERLCDRVVLLKNGKRRLYGTVDEIKKEYGSAVVKIQFKGKLPKKSDHYTVLQATSNKAELQPAEGVASEDLFKILAAEKNLQVSDFRIEQSSLDDIFVKIYQEEEHA